MSAHLHTKNPRGKKLNKIMTAIATFMVSETFQDETPAQDLLAKAVYQIEQAQDLLIKSDEAAAAQQVNP